MRVRLWLVVVFLVSRHLSVAAAEGEPRDSIAGEGVTGNAAVADTPLTRDAAKARVTVRVYSSTRIAAERSERRSMAQARLRRRRSRSSGRSAPRLRAMRHCRRRPRRARCTTEGDGDRHLGNALIDPQNRTGVLATYVNHPAVARSSRSTITSCSGERSRTRSTPAARNQYARGVRLDARGLVARRVAADTARRLDTSSGSTFSPSSPRTRRSRVWKSRRGQRPRRPLAHDRADRVKAGLSTRLRDCDC